MPGRLLAAVLQREEGEVGQPRDVALGGADAEDPAHQVARASREHVQRDAQEPTPPATADPPQRHLPARG